MTKKEANYHTEYRRKNKDRINQRVTRNRIIKHLDEYLEDIKNIKKLKKDLHLKRMSLIRLSNILLEYKTENKYLRRKNNMLEAKLKFLLDKNPTHINFKHIVTKPKQRKVTT